MPGLSVVIICKNEETSIERVLQSLQGLTDDIVVYDNGSTDATMEIAKRFNVNLREGSWEGFGKTKQKATALAKYDWVLNLDADEAIEEELKKELKDLSLEDEKTVYDIPFKNFIGDQYLRYGEWGGDHHIRLFNRKTVNWDDAPVHEQLVLSPGIAVKKLRGHVLHRTVKDMDDYGHKMTRYAMLNAEKYFQQGKKASWLKLRLSPGFTFFNYYILRLGFLDGHAGYVCAKMTAWYTFLKYARLKELWEQRGTKEQ